MYLRLSVLLLQIPNTKLSWHGDRALKPAAYTYKRYIIHAEDDHTLMFGRILRDASQMCFEYVIAIQEGHLAIWFDPHLVRH